MEVGSFELRIVREIFLFFLSFLKPIRVKLHAVQRLRAEPVNIFVPADFVVKRDWERSRDVPGRSPLIDF